MSVINRFLQDVAVFERGKWVALTLVELVLELDPVQTQCVQEAL